MTEIAKIKVKLWIKVWVKFAPISPFVCPWVVWLLELSYMRTLEKSNAKHKTVQQSDSSKQFHQTAWARFYD